MKTQEFRNIPVADVKETAKNHTKLYLDNHGIPSTIIVPEEPVFENGRWNIPVVVHNNEDTPQRKKIEIYVDLVVTIDGIPSTS